MLEAARIDPNPENVEKLIRFVLEEAAKAKQEELTAVQIISKK